MISRQKLPKVSAKFTVVLVDEANKAVWLSDDYDPTNQPEWVRTITNDAEAVVFVMNLQYPTYRVFYRDSEGKVNEILHSRAVFLGFAPNLHVEFPNGK